MNDLIMKSSIYRPQGGTNVLLLLFISFLVPGIILYITDILGICLRILNLNVTGVAPNCLLLNARIILTHFFILINLISRSIIIKSS